jgi:hypothetical protein
VSYGVPGRSSISVQASRAFCDMAASLAEESLHTPRLDAEQRDRSMGDLVTPMESEQMMIVVGLVLLFFGYLAFRRTFRKSPVVFLGIRLITLRLSGWLLLLGALAVLLGIAGLRAPS